MAEKPEQHPDSLLNAVQHEVSKETSPLLRFITNNSRLIAGGIVCFILAIGAYWVFESFRESGRLATQKEFGDIITSKEGNERADAIKAFIAKAPAEFHFNAYIALVQTALETGNREAALAAWEAAEKLQPSFGLEATLGKASALVGLKKVPEAVTLLQAKATELATKKDSPENKGALLYLYNRIGVLAEVAGDKPAALEAYKQLVSLGKASAQGPYWEQKVAALSRETK